MGLWPSTLAGRNRMALIRAKMASKVIPISRNGRDMSQTRGHNSRARMAKGQQRTNNMSQAINENIMESEIAVSFLVSVCQLHP